MGIETFAAAFLVGLLGGVHCLGMCGGIVTSLTLGIDPQNRASGASLFLQQLGYNLGRLLGYGAAGALVGGFGQMLLGAAPLHHAQRLLYGIAALFMIALGAYLGGWWMGLRYLERGGERLWRRIEPLGRRLLPIRSLPQALALGFLWAWIPCGLVYSVLIWALSAGSAGAGALLLLSFGLGTLPNLLGMGLLVGAAAHWMHNPWTRRIAGGLVLSFGLYASWQVLFPA